MPAVTLSPINVTPGNANVNWAPTTITSQMITDGVQVRFPRDGKLLIVVTNTAGSAKTVTLKAGDGIAKNQGNLTRQLAASTGTWVIRPEPSSRFKDKDGFLQLQFESGITGTIAALQIT